MRAGGGEAGRGSKWSSGAASRRSEVGWGCRAGCSVRPAAAVRARPSALTTKLLPREQPAPQLLPPGWGKARWSWHRLWRQAPAAGQALLPGGRAPAGGWGGQGSYRVGMHEMHPRQRQPQRCICWSAIGQSIGGGALAANSRWRAIPLQSLPPPTHSPTRLHPPHPIPAWPKAAPPGGWAQAPRWPAPEPRRWPPGSPAPRGWSLPGGAAGQPARPDHTVWPRVTAPTPRGCKRNPQAKHALHRGRMADQASRQVASPVRSTCTLGTCSFRYSTAEET